MIKCAECGKDIEDKDIKDDEVTIICEEEDIHKVYHIHNKCLNGEENVKR